MSNYSSLFVEIFSSITQTDEKFRNKQNVLNFLQHFVLKQHWKQIEKSLRHLDDDDPIWQGNNSCEVFRQVMRMCHGVLDVYGPEQYLGESFDAFWQRISGDPYYKDSHLIVHYAKKDILRTASKDAVKTVAGHSRSAQGIDNKLFNLMVESLNAQVDRQLAGTYEIVIGDWYESAIYVLGMSFKTTCFETPKLAAQCRKNAAEWAKSLSFVLAEFSKLFYEEHDQKLLVELKELLSKYFEDGKASNENCVYLHMAYGHLKEAKKTLLLTVEKSPYTSLPFSESRKILGSEFPVEPPVIRLITLGDDKILFAKDVENAIERVLFQKKITSTTWFNRFQVESEKEKDNGVYFTISRSEFLKILESLGLSADSITLVNTQVVQNPHFTSPILSPYGTECKPAADVLNEMLSIMTIELRVWERILPCQREQLESKLTEVCSQFMDPTKPRHFIECGRVERLCEHLRNSVKPLLRQPLSSLGPIKVSDVGFEDLIINLRLIYIYPEIWTAIPIHHAQHSNFYENLPSNTLKLIASIQFCLAVCFAQGIPMIRQFICSQEQCRLFGCWECACLNANLLPEDRSLYTTAVVTDEYDYQMKFDYFANQNWSYGSLIHKENKHQLVSGLMAHAFVMNNVLKQIEPKYRSHIALRPIFYEEMWISLKSSFYITSAEMMHLAEDVVRKFNLQRSDRFRRISEQLSCIDETARENVLIEWIYIVYFECIKFSASVFISLSTFENYLPNRKVVVPMLRCQVPDSDQKGLCVDSGQFLGLLKTKMLQSSVAGTRKDWEKFTHLVMQWKADDSFLLIPVSYIVEILDEFSVNPGDFYFVPEPDCVFNNFTQQVSYAIAQATNVVNSEADEKPKTKEISSGDPCKKEPDQFADNEIRRDLAQKTEELGAIRAKYSNLELAKKRAAKDHEKKVVKLNKEIENLRKEHVLKLAEEEKHSRGLTAKLAANETTVKEVRRELSVEKTNSVQQMRKKNDELKAMAEKLKISKSRIAEKEKTIEEQRNIVDSKEREIANKNKQISELRTQLLTEKRNAEEKVGDLTQRLAEVAVSRKEETEEVSADRIQMGVENRLLHTKLRMEKMDHESALRKIDAQRVHIKYLESVLTGQFSSPLLSPPITPSLPVLTDVLQQSTSSRFPFHPPVASAGRMTISESFDREKLVLPAKSDNLIPSSSSGAPIDRDSAPECIICLGVVGGRSRTAQCKECKTRFHSSCIEEWLQKKATCPVCSRSFPSPRNFPPLK